ncbi:hypothetical protein GH714_036143 [Hevea brasiliensis]|uniref:Pentacotripeptide-repeat region of PRORP domain-containing protein n=1 Tax=Hevea brasiliensis TaxID=3981 RepID=A0A6A6KKD9_HEVBR|nr:hypothetical protein GH714_036143 [Hevea brasiliensis]
MNGDRELLVVKRKPKHALSSEDVIAVLNSILDPSDAFAYFKTVAELPFVVHTTETCNHMLEILRIHKRVEDMAIVFQLMQKQIIRRDLNTYLALFKGLYIRGGLRQAPLALERMREAGFLLNAYSYNGLIHLLLQSGFCREALEVYRRMVSEGLKPSLKTYSALMVATGKRRDIKTVMGLLEEMESLGLTPNIYTYTICIRCRKTQQCNGIVCKMKASNHKPDRVTYITLLDKFSDSGDLDTVKEFWSEMEADGYVPDVVAFTILVNALCKVGNIDEAYDLLDVMRNARGVAKPSYLQYIDLWTFEGK